VGRGGGRVPRERSGCHINRFCASSLSATINVAHAIKAGDLGVGVSCGVESMSRSGWAYMKGDAPFAPRGPVLLLDTMWAGAGGPPNPALLARNAYIGIIETAQNVADRYKLTREEIDAFALRLCRRPYTGSTRWSWAWPRHGRCRWRSSGPA
jgi:acetyl-CoA acetyltransferase